MFEALLWVAILVAGLALFAALDGSRDVFHPLMSLMPMASLYGWMPLRLVASDGLARFFDGEQLGKVQVLNVLGILAFAVACLAAGARVRRPRGRLRALSQTACSRLRIGGAIVGSIGLACWTVSIVNVGGFTNAFNAAYGVGWDDNWYVRDGNLLLLVGLLLLVAVAAAGNVVTKSIPAWQIHAGNPAVFVRQRKLRGAKDGAHAGAVEREFTL